MEVRSKETRLFSKETENGLKYFLQVITYFDNACYYSDGFDALSQSGADGVYDVFLNTAMHSEIDHELETPVVHILPLEDLPLEDGFVLNVQMNVAETGGGRKGVVIGEVAEEDVRPYN